MSQVTDSPSKSASLRSLRNTRQRVVDPTLAVVRGGVTSLLNLVFPPACQLCWQDIESPTEVHVCGPCRAQLKARRPLCSACAMPLPTLALPADGCPACQNEQFRFADVKAVGMYKGLLREAVLRMKKGHEEVLTLTMGCLLAETVNIPGPAAGQCGPPPGESGAGGKMCDRPDLVVPVPMHWTRRITRGTNPAEVLAEMVARKLGIPAATDLLNNRRKTRKQGTLLPDQRRRNVRKAFSVSAGYDIKDTYVLLVDDVMTTGATCNELSKMLRQAGARKVSVAVVARGTG